MSYDGGLTVSYSYCFFWSFLKLLKIVQRTPSECPKYRPIDNDTWKRAIDRKKIVLECAVHSPDKTVYLVPSTELFNELHAAAEVPGGTPVGIALGEAQALYLQSNKPLVGESFPQFKKRSQLFNALRAGCPQNYNPAIQWSCMKCSDFHGKGNCHHSLALGLVYSADKVLYNIYDIAQMLHYF